MFLPINVDTVNNIATDLAHSLGSQSTKIENTVVSKRNECASRE